MHWDQENLKDFQTICFGMAAIGVEVGILMYLAGGALATLAPSFVAWVAVPFMTIGLVVWLLRGFQDEVLRLRRMP